MVRPPVVLHHDLSPRFGGHGSPRLFSPTGTNRAAGMSQQQSVIFKPHTLWREIGFAKGHSKKKKSLVGVHMLQTLDWID
jgi:hypothetical protein